MSSAARPTDEGARLLALRSYRVLNTPAEPVYDDITRLLLMNCDAPMASIILVDDKLLGLSRAFEQFQ